MEKLRCKYCENTCVKNGTLQTFWRTSSDNKLRGYFYEYDRLNRLKKAHYTKIVSNTSFFPGAYDEQLTYDRNGNILSLTRHTGDANENQIGMDNLSYTYQNGNNNSNQLLKVTDAVSGSSTGGFSNGSSGNNNDYTYDDNGNMTSDLNKGITEILYNHLNLPTLISFANGNSIEYLYNAAGMKIEKKVHDTQNNTIKQVEYMDGFQYAGGVLQFFPTSEGYVAATESNEIANPYLYNYVYNYTDHLGNIRLSYTKDPVSGDIEIMEENHYYPFGLKHQVYSTGPKQEYQLVEEEEIARPGYVYQTDYQYKYNGKEFQDELGLGLYDYGARNYDPALGRWMNIDPLAEKYYNFSTYTYAGNNPVIFIDPNGMEIINGETIKRQRLEKVLDNKQKGFDKKYGGNMNLKKKDFSTKSDWKDYKNDRSSLNRTAGDLKTTIKNEALVQQAINDFQSIDPENFNKVNNLTFKDSNGVEHDIDIKVVSGEASKYGGAFTATNIILDSNGNYQSISSIVTTLDFGDIKPNSHVFAHEMGHAYGNASNPVMALSMGPTHNCQDPANRNSFQSKTAMDWQERYDKMKKQFPTPQAAYYMMNVPWLFYK